MTVTVLLVCLIYAASGRSDAVFRNVTISNGTVKGIAIEVGGSKVWQFLGIPFAQNPTGLLRFARPRSLTTKWPGVFDATRVPNRCSQKEGYPSFPPSGAYSEDCLTLNVWTPTSKNSTAFPVMVWIHGGSFKKGEAYPKFDGRALSALGNVIVVTIQYRIGALGFWSPDIHRGANWALWDQQLALRWVRENIGAFGGDPHLVTIFGESAGAACVSMHLLNADSRSLFRRAIAQSGSSLAPWAFTGQAESMSYFYLDFAGSLGCKDVSEITSCMRRLNASLLAEKSGGMTWMPVVDGAFLTDKPRKIVTSLRDHEYMLGVNQNEGWWFINNLIWIMKGKVSTETIYKAYFDVYPEFPLKMQPATRFAFQQRLVSHENVSSQKEHLRRYSMAFSEIYFFCPASLEADLYAQNGTRLFAYEFAHRPSNARYPPNIGPTHEDEIQFVFAFDALHRVNFTADERALSRAMIRDWTAFARSGRPSNAAWKQYSSKAREFQKLAVKSEPKTFFYKRNDCVFWDSLLPLVDSLARSYKSGSDSLLIISSTTKIFIGLLGILSSF